MEAELVDVPPTLTAVLRQDVTLGELPQFFDRAFRVVYEVLERQGLAPAGPPFAHYPARPTARFTVEAGFPTARRIDPDGEVEPGELPGGTVLRAVHIGPYEALERTYGEVQALMAARGLEPADHMWEVYLSDPSAEPDPATWRTEIVWPVSMAG